MKNYTTQNFIDMKKPFLVTEEMQQRYRHELEPEDIGLYCLCIDGDYIVYDSLEDAVIDYNIFGV